VKKPFISAAFFVLAFAALFAAIALSGCPMAADEPPSFVAVSGIVGVPERGVRGEELNLNTASVTPAGAANRTIVWTLVDPGATGLDAGSLPNGKVLPPATGRLKLRAVVKAGKAPDTDYAQDFTVPVVPARDFVAVSGITRVPSAGVKNLELELDTAEITPPDATNRTIVWTLVDAGTTGVIAGDLADGRPVPSASGVLILRAAIADGGEGEDYIEDFTIIITDEFVAVSGVTGVPLTGKAGAEINLNAAGVVPVTASRQNISWSVLDGGDTGLSAGELSDGRVVPSRAGVLKLTAVIRDGKGPGTDYSQEFTIVIVEEDTETSTPESSETLIGIEIASLPDITLYAKNQPFSSAGLRVVRVYSDSSTELLSSSEYTLSPAAVDTSVGGQPIRLTVRADGFEKQFAIFVENSTSVLQSITLSAPPSQTAYSLLEDFNKTGMVITGVFLDETGSSTKTIDSGVCEVLGYDKTKRGKQQVRMRVNRKDSDPLEVTVKIPQGTSITLNRHRYMTANHQHLFYRPVRVKGAAFDPARSNLKASVTTGGRTIVLNWENGGITEADLANSGYNPSVTGMQTLTLNLDGNTLPFDIYVADAESDVWFDYGYWRHEQDSRGAGPGAGVYYAKPNETLVLSPVRFLIGYDADNKDTGVSYTWSAPDGSYTTSSGGEFCYFTPQAAGTYTVQVSVTGRDFVSGGIVTKSASTDVVCYTDSVGQPAGKTYRPPVKNFAPGQHNEGVGIGWSLGSALGYEVWSLPNGAATLEIYGNPFGSWSEPGIVWVQYDANGNGVPDETWYELMGDEDDTWYKNMITRRYALSYFRGPDPIGTKRNADGQLSYDPALDPEGVYSYTSGHPMDRTVFWVDAKGRVGRLDGWPYGLGLSDDLNTRVTFTGTLLRDSGNIGTGDYGDLPQIGYVDAAGGSDKFPYSRFNAARDAIRADGSAANLDPKLVRFVKVQTAFWRYGGIYGNVSTEIVKGTNLSDQSGGFPMPWD
jgi:hypothetical protein